MVREEKVLFKNDKCILKYLGVKVMMYIIH